MCAYFIVKTIQAQMAKLEKDSYVKQWISGLSARTKENYLMGILLWKNHRRTLAQSKAIALASEPNSGPTQSHYAWACMLKSKCIRAKP
jgi:hypothetical protein